MKILVTGGAGFMGCHLTDFLIENGDEVVVLDDLSGGFEENVNQKAIFINGSVTNKDLVKKLFEDYKFDYVFHLAAYAAEGLSHFIRKFNYENNLIGSINLINESVKQKIKAFVFTSSIAVYGEGQTPFTEETIPKPEDPYGISKYAVELDLIAANKMFGLNYIIFRPHNVYGEKQNLGDKYRNVVGIFMNQIMQNKPLTIFGDGKQTRAFTHISDVTPIIAKSIEIKESYNQIFNIGADKPYTVNILTKEVIKAMGVQEDYPLDYLPPRNEAVDAHSDHSKIKNIFNYEPRISLEEGIKKMAEWAKKQGIKKSSSFGNIELTEGLPKKWIEE